MKPTIFAVPLLLLLSSSSSNARHISKQEELVLIHALFRHGNRTANGPEELYPNDPYVNKTYFPIGLGQLTEAGKRREYSIGRQLRTRYDSFLGPLYYPQIVDAWSTDYNRTKMSLLLTLAGLFPPKEDQIWNPAIKLWQPIPYNYRPSAQDEVLVGVVCPNYMAEYNRYIATPKVRSEFDKYRQLFKYLTKNTGKNISTFLDGYNLYFGLATEEEFGLPLPAWTKKVWPQDISELAVNEYFIAMGTTKLRQIGVGYFLKKLIEDTEAKIKQLEEDPNKEDPRKIYLYSAHENNVAEFLLVLGIFNPPHVPTYGSYVTVEVLKIGGTNYGIRIVYENYTKSSPQRLKLPGCQEICEINKFKSLVEEYLPTSENMCGNKKC